MVWTVEADALVLLGCRIAPDGRPGPAALRRCQAAARAYHEGVAEWVLVSGGVAWHGVPEARAMADELWRLGVSSHHVVLELASTTTFENAWFSAGLLASRDARRIIVVTCDFHMRRSLWQFRRRGLEARGLSAPTPGLKFGRRGLLGLRETGSLLLQAPLEVLWEL